VAAVTDFAALNATRKSKSTASWLCRELEFFIGAPEKDKVRSFFIEPAERRVAGAGRLDEFDRCVHRKTVRRREDELIRDGTR
jgi:hypothetical protein